MDPRALIHLAFRRFSYFKAYLKVGLSHEREELCAPRRSQFSREEWESRLNTTTRPHSSYYRSDGPEPIRPPETASRAWRVATMTETTRGTQRGPAGAGIYLHIYIDIDTYLYIYVYINLYIYINLYK